MARHDNTADGCNELTTDLNNATFKLSMKCAFIIKCVRLRPNAK